MRWFKRTKPHTPNTAPNAESDTFLSPKSSTLPYSSTFVEQAVAFKQDLAAARDFEEISALWRNTNFPYQMESTDPFSDAYRTEVQQIYQKLVDSPYDVQNELTSSHLSKEDFARGYPWTSNNLNVVAHEIGKAVQGFRVIAQHVPEAKSLIEFGVGWGNTAIPLARAGLDVCAVDIDEAFLSRATQEAQALNAEMKTLHADFLEAAKNPGQRYDVALFSSSFHHCLEFENLLVQIKENVLTPNGCIAFFAEPISNGSPFPWGLRHDGEAVWAITCNKWLELGFSEDFFRALIDRTGFKVEEIPDSSGLMGPGWIARPV